MKGKNKLVPRLLGVNKDSVVRVDLQTKEVCILISYKSVITTANGAHNVTKCNALRTQKYLV